MKRENVLRIKTACVERVEDTVKRKTSSTFIAKQTLYEEYKRFTKQVFSVENYFLLEYKIAATARSTDARAISGNA